jgi:di/tricarboxylate transporter
MTWIFESSEFHMWFVLILTGLAIISFAKEKFPLEVTSVALLTILLLFGQFFPVMDANGRNQLDAMGLLSGFSNPSLVAVLALLVMGQAIIHSDALRPITKLFMVSDKRFAWISIFGILLFVMVVSAFMNNTPLVILAIPLLQTLAMSAGLSESRVMMPLSYAAILGGMTTLVGSSTNLLVSSSMEELGYNPLSFFHFTVPGLMLASVGLVYIIFVLPRLIPDRASMTQQLVGSKKEFIAELDVMKDSNLVGMEFVEGRFPNFPDMKVRLIQRSGHLILPPFEGYIIEPGDIMIVAATRDFLAELLSQSPGFLLSDDEAKIMDEGLSEEGDEEEDGPAELEEKVAETRILAEVMITPGSRMIDMSLEQVGFHRQFGAIVLGIQRRARVVRRRLGRIRLEAGDVLLMAGSQASIDSMRGNQDLIVLSGSKKELPVPKKAPLAAGILLAVISLAAFGVLSIPVAAITGSVILIATNCLNIRQAVRAIDRKIFLLVGSMLALGTALQVTGGAKFIAELMLQMPFADVPIAVAAVLFLLVALFTNVLTNNATAILFTPIALNLAVNLGVDPYIFATTIIFAANCSFASPIGYQTNLLVMGPGHYRFRDFMKAGIPLVIIIWLAYLLVAKFYYGL